MSGHQVPTTQEPMIHGCRHREAASHRPQDRIREPGSTLLGDRNVLRVTWLPHWKPAPPAWLVRVPRTRQRCPSAADEQVPNPARLAPKVETAGSPLLQGPMPPQVGASLLIAGSAPTTRRADQRAP